MKTLETYHRQRRSIFYPKADWSIPDGDLRKSRAGATAFAFTDAAAAKLAGTVLQRDIVGVERLPEGGTSHQLWAIDLDADSVILRLNSMPDHLVDWPMVVEAGLTRHLTGESFPVLETRCVDLSRERCPTDFSIVNEAHGLPLKNLDDDERLLMPLLRQLGELLGRLHNLKATTGFGWIRADAEDPMGNREARQTHFHGLSDSWTDFLEVNFESHLSRCVELEALNFAEAERVEGWFERLRPTFAAAPSALLHNDLSSANVFTDGRRINAILDWEDAIIGDPLFDVAGLANFHPVRRHASFLDGYFRQSKPASDFGVRFGFYYLRIALARTVLRDRLGLTDKPGREPAARRVRWALQELESPRKMAA